MDATGNPHQFLTTALTAVRDGRELRDVLDALPVPVYITDAAGIVTHWNAACVDVVGREPRTGEDQWCVTWKLYTLAGDFLPHEQCPMARAIRERREIRNEILIAERPDGSRIACRVYPTPYFNEQNELSGAVNLFIDVTREQTSNLMEQAARCRRLARSTTDARAAAILGDMAQSYSATADSLHCDAHPGDGTPIISAAIRTIS